MLSPGGADNEARRQSRKANSDFDYIRFGAFRPFRLVKNVSSLEVKHFVGGHFVGRTFSMERRVKTQDEERIS